MKQKFGIRISKMLFPEFSISPPESQSWSLQPWSGNKSVGFEPLITVIVTKSVFLVLRGKFTNRLVADLVILKVNKYPTRFYYNKKSIFSRVSQSGIALLGKPHPYFALEAWHLHWNLNFMLDLDPFHYNFPMIRTILLLMTHNLWLIFNFFGFWPSDRCLYRFFSPAWLPELFNLRIELMRIEQKCLFLNERSKAGDRRSRLLQICAHASLLCLFVFIHETLLPPNFSFSVGIAKKF